uniref:ABC transporter domain-containing protein n=1 Tax=Tetradesmus obliquus TaxID=3088 RepID=A0A383W084_TETOB|eukprot:jgi/Sobl393_1/951/SZX70600.1
MGSSWLDVLDVWGERVLRGRFAQQFAALFYKNVLVAWRSRRTTAIRLLAPFLFLLLALVVALALNANNALQERFVATPNAAPEAIASIPSCHEDLHIGFSKPCIDFVYSPNNDTTVNRIVQAIMATNEPPIPADKVLGFTSRRAAEEHLGAHPDGALGALHFSRSGERALSYIVQANTTVKYFKGSFQDPTLFFAMPMVNAAARELTRHHLAANPNSKAGAASGAGAAGLVWAPRLAKFPHPSLQSSSLLGQVLSSFIFASLMFGFVTQMSNLVSEKQAGLRLALRNMGMLDSAYWASWMAFDAVITLLTALLLVLFGMALQFGYFIKNDFGLLLMLFWLFGLAMTSYSYVLSVMVKKSQAAVYLGFAVFIVGWVFQTVIFVARLPYRADTYYSETNVWGRVFFWVFALFPWNPLTKGILDFNEATLAATDPGLRWHQQYSYCTYRPNPADQPEYDPREEFRSYDCVFPLWQAYLTLTLQWAGYWALAAYLNNVLPNEVGTRRPWWYLLSRSYWRPRPADRVAALRRVVQEEAAGTAMPPPCSAPVDDDVAAEQDRMRALLAQRIGDEASALPGGGSSHHSTSSSSAAAPPAYAAELYGLRKVFKAPSVTFAAAGASLNACVRCQGPEGRRAVPLRDFWAVAGSWLGIPEGQLFCLLGPNGAGKTTTINCLTGVLPFSGGDALIYGTSISGEGGLDAVRPLMGVCPQFDVLWGELTGREHLAIAGHIKGLRFSTVRREAEELLGRVKLGHAAAVRSGSYSGGMKRRLSVALALLGDPKIVYLDEPTTGMDPISRRYVWDIIQAAKPGRAIVLTTHSMEEADILGDRIGIMARGRLQALGSSIRLKQRFGSGYQLTVHIAMPRNMSYSSLAAAEQQSVAARMARVKAFFRSGLGVEPLDEGRSLLQYLVTREAEGALVGFLQQLEAQAGQLGVCDVQCSLASLEEVFLTIAKRAELEAAAQAGNSLVPVEAPDGGRELLVPLGEEEVMHPSGDGRSYRVKWAQDDAGRLVVLDVTLAQQQQQQQQQQQVLRPQAQQQQRQRLIHSNSLDSAPVGDT